MSQEYLDFSCIKLTTQYTPNDCGCITVICFLMNGAEVYVDDRSESSRAYDMIICRDLLGELGIIMNFNDHTVTWDTDNRNYSNKRQR
jgi:hypothetical protein